MGEEKNKDKKFRIILGLLRQVRSNLGYIRPCLKTAIKVIILLPIK